MKKKVLNNFKSPSKRERHIPRYLGTTDLFLPVMNTYVTLAPSFIEDNPDSRAGLSEEEDSYGSDTSRG